MKENTRKVLYDILPTKLKSMRSAYVKGRIGEGAKDDNYFYDRGFFQHLANESYSQYGQDIFIHRIIFNGKKEGIFLDIGGNDPIELNNTYFFEKEGWTGLAFEPIKRLADSWKEVRITPCLNIALGNENKEIEFIELKSDELSGGGGAFTYDKKDVAAVHKVEQIDLTTVLEERNIFHVDYASIDVEGNEMNVLRGIDFGKIDISVFSIENNRNGDDKPDYSLRSFLAQKGYRFIGRLTIDDIFVKESFFCK